MISRKSPTVLEPAFSLGNHRASDYRRQFGQDVFFRGVQPKHCLSMHAHGDYRRAAEIAGVGPTKFHRRWQETTLGNIRATFADIATSERIGSLLNEGNENGEEEIED